MSKRGLMVSVIAAAVLAVACKSEDSGNGAAGTGGAPAGGAGGIGGVGASGTGAGSGAAGTASTAGTGGTGGNAGTAAAGTSGGSGAGGTTGGTGGMGASGMGGAGGMGASGMGGTGGMGSGGALTLTSSVVQDGAMIPATHRCEGPSPPLAWSGGPTAMSYAILFKDITPGISEGYVHWLIYDIPASTMSLPMMVPTGYAPASPAGAHQGPIWNDVVGYNGPCAPFGMNTYEFILYALDVAMLPDLSMDSTSDEIETALEAHKLETTKLTIKSMP